MLDVSEESGVHYIAMQYVAGENARQRVERKGALPVDGAVARRLRFLMARDQGLCAAVAMRIVS